MLARGSQSPSPCKRDSHAEPAGRVDGVVRSAMQLGALLQDWTTKDLVEADFKDRIRLRNHHRRGSDTSAKNRVAAALEGSLAIGWEKAVDERVARGLHIHRCLQANRARRDPWRRDSQARNRALAPASRPGPLGQAFPFPQPGTPAGLPQRSPSVYGSTEQRHRLGALFTHSSYV